MADSAHDESRSEEEPRWTRPPDAIWTALVGWWDHASNVEDVLSVAWKLARADLRPEREAAHKIAGQPLRVAREDQTELKRRLIDLKTGDPAALRRGLRWEALRTSIILPLARKLAIDPDLVRSRWPRTTLAATGSDDDVKYWTQAVIVAFGGFDAWDQSRVPDDQAWRQ